MDMKHSQSKRISPGHKSVESVGTGLISSWLSGSGHAPRQSRVEPSVLPTATPSVPGGGGAGMHANIAINVPHLDDGVPAPAAVVGGAAVFPLETPPPLRGVQRRASLVTEVEDPPEEIAQELMIGEIKVCGVVLEFSFTMSATLVYNSRWHLNPRRFYSPRARWPYR